MPSQQTLATLRLQLMAEEYKARVGARIRKARNAKGWSQGKLARELAGNTDGPSVSRWERGLVMPGSANLDALAAALDQDVSYFLVEEPLNETPDLMGAMQAQETQTQLDRIESKLDALAERLDGLTLRPDVSPSEMRDELQRLLDGLDQVDRQAEQGNPKRSAGKGRRGAAGGAGAA